MGKLIEVEEDGTRVREGVLKEPKTLHLMASLVLLNENLVHMGRVM